VRIPGVVKNGLLVAISLGLTLAMLEVTIRLVWPQPTGITHQDRYGLALHYPGITRYMPQYGHSVSFNEVGMRDRDHPLEKSPGTFRILLLGDSFMEALQVPFEASLPSLLEEELGRRTGRKVEVINAGVSGWGTDDELRYLTSYGVAYHPDLVLVAMTLHNDISDNLRQDWHRLKDGRLITRDRQPMPAMDYRIVQLKAYLSTRFQLYQLWRRARHGSEIREAGRQLRSHVAQLFEEPTPEGIAKGVSLTGLLLRQVQEVTTSQGGKVVLFLLPIVHQLSDSSFAEFARTSGVPLDSLRIGKPQQLIRPLADSIRMPVIDLYPRFRQWVTGGGAHLYVDWDGHWNETGHRLAAEVVTEGLLQTGSVPTQ
jgi:hypothetical protein